MTATVNVPKQVPFEVCDSAEMIPGTVQLVNIQLSAAIQRGYVKGQTMQFGDPILEDLHYSYLFLSFPTTNSES